MDDIRRAVQNQLTTARTLLCISFLLFPSAHAAEGDPIQAHVSASTTYDDNVFRLSDNLTDAETLAAIGSTSTSDVTNRLEAGLDADLKFSRQRLLLGLSVERNSFNKFDFLNFTGKSANATLEWEVGNRVKGDAGFTYRDTLSGFGLLQARIRDQQIRRTQFVNANYEFYPGLQVHGGFETFDLRRDVLSDRNRDENTRKLGVRYTSRASNFIDLEARYTDGNVGNGTVENDFTQSEINAEVDYSRSKSHINGTVGLVHRNQEQAAIKDFNGIVGRVIYDWSVTGKTLISMSVWRQVRSTEDLLSSYTISHGASITPSWSPTEKTIVQGRLSHERFKFQGSDDREDSLRIAGISLGYTPLRNTRLAISYQNEDRSSNVTNAGYNDNVVTGSVRVDF